MKGCGYVLIDWTAKTFMLSILRLIVKRRIKNYVFELVSFLTKKRYTFYLKIYFKMGGDKARLIKLLNDNKIKIIKRLIS